MEAIYDLSYGFNNIIRQIFHENDKIALFALLIKGYIYIK